MQPLYNWPGKIYQGSSVEERQHIAGSTAGGFRRSVLNGAGANLYTITLSQQREQDHPAIGRWMPYSLLRLQQFQPIPQDLPSLVIDPRKLQEPTSSWNELFIPVTRDAFVQSHSSQGNRQAVQEHRD